jgi:hypothetical protein
MEPAITDPGLKVFEGHRGGVEGDRCGERSRVGIDLLYSGPPSERGFDDCLLRRVAKAT